MRVKISYPVQPETDLEPSLSLFAFAVGGTPINEQEIALKQNNHKQELFYFIPGHTDEGKHLALEFVEVINEYFKCSGVKAAIHSN